MHQNLAAAEIGGKRLAGRLRRCRQRVDDAGDRIGRDCRGLEHSKAAVRLGHHEIGKRSAGVDRETKLAPTQTQLPP